MPTKSKKSITDKVKELPNIVKGVSVFISSLIVIFGFVGSATLWVSNKITEDVSNEIQGLNSTVQDIRMDTVRLQLLELMNNDSDNVESILTVARKYFIDLKGDWYMTKRFKEWAKRYDIDLSDFTFVHE